MLAIVIFLMSKLRNFDWRQEAAYLLETREKVAWHPGASSFSDWLKKHAKQQGIQISSLWRYLNAAAFAVELQTSHWSGVKTPAAIPDKVSAEALEILEKIGRVAPKAIFEQLAADLYEGKIRRLDLLNTWQHYREALSNHATARGRGVKRPTLGEDDEIKQSLAFKQQVWLLLRQTDPLLLGYSAPVTQLDTVGLKAKASCDTILIGRGADKSIFVTELVAVMFKASRKSLQPLIDRFSEQRLWLIVPQEKEGPPSPRPLSRRFDLPDNWGIIRVSDATLVLENQLPAPSEHLPLATRLLLSQLL